MKFVQLVAIFFFSCVVNAYRDCRLECYQAAVSYRIGKSENVENIEEYVLKHCEEYAKNLYYKCSKAVPLILNNEDIKKTIERVLVTYRSALRLHSQWIEVIGLSYSSPTIPVTDKPTTSLHCDCSGSADRTMKEFWNQSYLFQAWDLDVPSDRKTEEAVKKYCWKACRNAYFSPKF